MSLKSIKAGALLALLTLPAAEAVAGDWNNGAGPMAPHGGAAAVPVPAPVPIPEMAARWYIRGDIGYAVGSTGRIKTEGPDVGIFKSFGDSDGPLHGGIGFGRYITPNMRVDFTLDFRPDRRIGKKNTRYYQTNKIEEAEQVDVTGVVNGQTLTISTRSWDIHSYDVYRTEESRDGVQTALVNVYYDFDLAPGIKPYIGIGAGGSINTIKRRYNETGTCVGTDQVYEDPFSGLSVITPRGGVGAPPICTDDVTTFASRGAKVDTVYGFVGAISAGLAYQVTDGIAVDVGYRYLWNAATVDSLIGAGPGGFSRMSWSTQVDHELRTGLRFDLN
jgi:opacity protein-like surface antigen